MSNPLSSFYSKIATAQTRAALTAALVFLLPFERIPSLDIFSVTIRLSQLAGAALVVVSIGPIINFYKARPYLPKFILPAFFLSYLLSALLATDLRRAIMVWVFTVFVALVGSAIAATFTTDELPRLEKYLYISTAIVMVVGFYQYFGDVFGLSPALTGLRSIYTKEVFGFPRIQSVSLEPLYYGSFLLIPYCLLLAKRLKSKTSTAISESVLLFFIVMQVALSVSRGAIIGALVSLFAIAILYLFKKQLKFKQMVKVAAIILAGAVAAYSLTLISPKTTNAKYTGEKKAEKLIEQATNLKSQNDRVRNRTIAIKAFKENPVFGIGPGNFNQYAIKEFPRYARVAPVIVNNEPIELLAESGIVGFVLFLVFVGVLYIIALVRYLKDKYANQALNYWVPALLIYLIALAIQYQTFSTLYVMHVWVVIGLLMAFTKTEKKPTR